MKRAIILIGMIALSGCSFAPPYQRPPMNIPANYKEDGKWLSAQPNSAILDRGPWWMMYDDSVLNDLEAKIEGANQNLQAAVSRYDEARAILAEQRSALYPSLIGVFNANRQHSSENVANPLTTRTYNDFLLSANVTYELDVWGRVRNSVASAKSLAEASAADLATVDLSLHAELANDYFALRSNDTKQRVVDKVVVVYGKTLELTRNLYQGGAVALPDLEQAEYQWENAKTIAAEIHLQRAQLEHAIAVLVGLPPADLTIKPEVSKPKRVTIAPLLPSTLLERRPDVAEAELRVQAANYNIGVARAAFFPAFNLSAAIGFESEMLSNLLKGSSLVWALGPTTSSALLNNGSMPLVTQTIYDGGRLIALTQQAWAQYFEAISNYRQTVLTAFQEVEDNLVAIRQLDQEIETQTRATVAANHSFGQSLYRYQGGLTTYLDVAVFQDVALQAQLSSIDIEERRQVASVQLIKALGGGFGPK